MFLESDSVFYFNRISKFDSLKNPFAMITSLSEFHFRCRSALIRQYNCDFLHIIFLTDDKWLKELMSSGRSTNDWKSLGWMRLELIFPMRDIYINSILDSVTKINSSSRRTKFKDILPWNIYQIITNSVIISAKVEQDCQGSLIQGKIHIAQNLNEDLDYWSS